MALITAPALIISPVAPEQGHWPLIGWDNQVSFSNVTADSETAGYPVTNLANALTVSEWRSGSTAEQLVTIDGLEGQSDYIGLARHNLGSAGVLVTVEGITAEEGAAWEELLADVIPGTDAPLLLRFAKDYYIGLRLRLVQDATAPTIAVMKAGALQTFGKGLTPGYTPLSLAKQIDVQNGRSQTGEYLGTIITGSALGSTASFRDLEADWFEEYALPLVAGLNSGDTFFWAWEPTARPDDVAYAFLSATAVPVINRATGQYDLDLAMGAVAL